MIELQYRTKLIDFIQSGFGKKLNFNSKSLWNRFTDPGTRVREREMTISRESLAASVGGGPINFALELPPASGPAPFPHIFNHFPFGQVGTSCTNLQTGGLKDFSNL